MNKQKEINEMIDRVRGGLVDLLQRKYLGRDATIHLLDRLQEKINEILDDDNDYIRW